MTKIIHLEITNFRGIKTLDMNFNKNLVSFIGRGDSCKTTILEAISSVLSPSWNLTFHDTDFHHCNTEEPIIIKASILNPPEKLITENKYGLHIRALSFSNEIIDEFDEQEDSAEKILTIKLEVNRELEPKWTVTCERGIENKTISAGDRALFGCFVVADYVDRHFSWNKGSPLYALLKLQESSSEEDNSSIILDALRTAKDKIDEEEFTALTQTTLQITNQAALLGLNISETKTTIDFKDLSIRDGRVCLHDNKVPFRLKGKGSKRLASIAIQCAMAQAGGIVLIDEIEQGLEPDRIKQLVRALKDNNSGQIFITTHARDAITELGSEPLVFLLKDKKTENIEKRYFDLSSADLQKTIRACPEAFFAKKVIICEGATEVGICRALDKWRRNNNKSQMSFEDCAYVDGTGNTIVQRVKEINDAGLRTALLCDSDLLKINNEKSQWVTDGISIFDCEDDLCLEQQVFKDLPWDGVKELLQYARTQDLDSFSSAFSDYISTPIEDWNETTELKNKVISEFKTKNNGDSGKKWFKALHRGEAMGDIIFKHVNELDDDARLKKTLMGLSDWIDEDCS